jgi:hypothetical protein
MYVSCWGDDFVNLDIQLLDQIVEIKFMHATSNGLAPSHYMLRSKFAPASMVISLLRNHYNFSKENTHLCQ